MLPFQTENESPGNVLNPFTVCSPCKRNFVVCPFADENTNRSYPLANGLHGINGINESAYLANSYAIHLYMLNETPCWTKRAKIPSWP